VQRKVLIISLIITLLVIGGLTLKSKLPDKVNNDSESAANLVGLTSEENSASESTEKSDKQGSTLQKDSQQQEIGNTEEVAPTELNQPQRPVRTTEQKSTASNQPKNPSVSRESLERDLITLINNDRKKNGLKALEIDSQVTALARKKSEDMRDNNYFATKSPKYGTFTDMLKASNIDYRTAAEKIAGGYQSAQEVFNNWLKDPDFRKSILEQNYTHIGVGYASGSGEYRYYWSLWLVEKPVAISLGSQSSYEKEVLELVNVERSNKGLKPLQWDAQLAEVARAKSKDMRDKNYFAHQSPTYGSLGEMLKFFNVDYSSAAENIAAGQKTPDAVVTGWMNSEGHRKNILDPKLTHLGVGYADGGGDYFIYWTQTFTTKP